MADTVINGISVPFLPIGGVDGLKQRAPVDGPVEGSFNKILQKELKELKFSKHAQQRLDSQQITLSESDMQNLQTAVQKAEDKGSQDALVLLRDMAFVVSVRNRTVVTAVDNERMKDNVFTNIDSAIIAA
ncbi:MAG: flagellar protein [Ignavibacteriales bacterium]|nr:flagellar protein [Ignavibacteriales bacterium]